MSINYNELTEITVHNQQELDGIPTDFKGRIYIECTATVKVSNRYYWSVVARENSSVVAWGNSSVVARENSSVVAWENSSVEARENSSVVASANSQVVNRLVNGKIKLSGNAREVFMPRTIHEFMDFYGIKHTKTKATFYKAVRKAEDGTLYADYNNDFTYEIGKYKSELNINTDVTEECGSGINIAHLAWALGFGRDWDNLAIIEVETKIADIILPEDSTGKVRTSKVKVIREVPLEECGIMGKIIARKHSTRT